MERYMARNPDKGLPGCEREEVIAPEKVVVKTKQIYCKKLADDTPLIHGRGYRAVTGGKSFELFHPQENP